MPLILRIWIWEFRNSEKPSNYGKKILAAHKLSYNLGRLILHINTQYVLNDQAHGEGAHRAVNGLGVQLQEGGELEQQL